MNNFDIEFVKLENGIHSFQYEIDGSFFESFKNLDIQGAHVDVRVSLNKTESVLYFDIQGKGYLNFQCDRCLSEIQYPVNTDFKVVYHLNAVESKIDEAQEVNLDVFYLSGTQYKVNIADSIYESFLSEIPMVKRCDDVENNECNAEMIDCLEDLEENKEGKNEIDPRWEELKKLLNKEK